LHFSLNISLTQHAVDLFRKDAQLATSYTTNLCIGFQERKSSIAWKGIFPTLLSRLLVGCSVLSLFSCYCEFPRLRRRNITVSHFSVLHACTEEQIISASSNLSLSHHPISPLQALLSLENTKINDVIRRS